MNMMTRDSAIKTIICVSIALAVYFSLLGSVLPGGGFAAGVMIAAAYIASLFSPWRERVEGFCPTARLLTLCCCGLFLFIVLALIGGGDFLGDAFLSSRKLSIIALNASLALSYGAGLSCIVSAFSSYKTEEAAK